MQPDMPQAAWLHCKCTHWLGLLGSGAAPSLLPDEIGQCLVSGMVCSAVFRLNPVMEVSIDD